MEQIFKLSFKCRIIRVFPNGFTAILKKGYLIKFQDKNYRIPFHEGDNIFVTLANDTEPRQEYLRPSYLVIYCIIKNFLPNGIQFIDINNQKKGFFWDYRGLLTNEIFEESDIWEKDTLLRIMIKKDNIQRISSETPKG